MPLDVVSDTFLDDDPLLEVHRVERDARLVLERAAQLVERGWCRDAAARWGWWAVSATAARANRWCASGAIDRAAYELQLSPYYARGCLTQVAAAAGYPNIARWNDGSWTRRRVLSGLRRAAVAG